jgi:hypothetical protein
LGFLGSPRFAAKTLEYRYWIYLDFLGFSRADRDFSMGYADKSEKLFSFPLLVSRPSHRKDRPQYGMRKDGVLMGQA